MHPVLPRATRAVWLALAVLSLLIGFAVTASPASALPAHPNPSHALPRAIEPMTAYVPENVCDPVVRPGTLALARLLQKTYRGVSYGTVRPCTASVSEHYDGRAIDFMTSFRNATQAAQAHSLINWLLATDAAGNKFAMARRLGIMYIVANNHIWGTWNGRWEDYQGCTHKPQAVYDNDCHRTHVHLSLSWAGAYQRTSFWTGRVAATDYGPCAPADMNYAAPYSGFNPNRCVTHAPVAAPRGSGLTRTQLYEYSGKQYRTGDASTGVTAIQRALHLTPTGTYDVRTGQAVARFNAAHHTAGGARMTYASWRALRASVK